jgi:ribosome recycling factor
MSPNQVIDEVKAKLAQAVDHFKQELGKLRTGRAHPAMLDGVMVEAYGQPMPIKSVAGISVPEPQLLQVSPFDPTNIQAIATAIRDNPSLDLSPTDDGRVVRITIPPLTTESRQQMVKILGQKVEEALISARNARHEAMRIGDQAEKDKQMGRDERLRFEKQIDELLAKNKTEIEQLQQVKEQEITTL